MRTLKALIGAIVALAAILYCGGLLYYFIDLSGSVHEAERDGLGPTLLGLGTVGLLFCILFVVRKAQIFARPRSPGSGGRRGPDLSAHDDEGGFDADAALARYLARRSTEAAPPSPAAPPAREGGGPARRPSFGRRGPSI